MTTQNLNRISPIWSRSAAVIADHGEGIYLVDKDGRRYMDFTSGIGVTNTGHAHPQVVQAVQQQAGKILHAQANIVYHEPMIRLTEELSQVVPAKLDTFFFSN
ncbi:MAG TPA: aminotransferase class III-fold pyridoxal phosphate-dependent enzyme, partial [Chloroflexota bacterium]|nr:aminotransferase class III-fold pyridoxal phosphate-dependent enzyme [Chloroflexota bacterium]